MSLTINDLEHLQAKLSEAHLDYQLELVEGNIVVSSPSDIISSEITVEFCSQLRNWVKPRRLGRVLESSGGFILPDSNLRALDVSFIAAERLKRSQRSFANLVPDLTVEVKSKTDRIKPLVEKIQYFLSLGARVGILIDPDKYTVTIYCQNNEFIVLGDEDILTIPELFPGWELPISELWSVEFE